MPTGFPIFDYQSDWPSHGWNGFKSGWPNYLGEDMSTLPVPNPSPGWNWQWGIQNSIGGALALGLFVQFGIYFRYATDDRDMPSFGGDLWNDTNWAATINLFADWATFVEYQGGHGLTFDTEINGDGWLTDGYAGDTHTRAENRAKWRQRGQEIGYAIWSNFPNCVLGWYSFYMPHGMNAQIQISVNAAPSTVYEDDAQNDLFYGLMAGMKQANATDGLIVIYDASWYRSAQTNLGGSANTAACYKMSSQGPRAWMSQYFNTVSGGDEVWNWAQTRCRLGNGFVWLGTDATPFYTGSMPSPAAWSQQRLDARAGSEGEWTQEYWFYGTPEAEEIANYDNATVIAGGAAAASQTPLSTSPPSISAVVASETGGNVTVTCNVSHLYGVLAVELFSGDDDPDADDPLASAVMTWNRAGGTHTTNFNGAYMECTMETSGAANQWFIIKATSIRMDRAYAAVQVPGVVFDVTDYGATGNGSTNDTSAVNTAAAAAAGDTLYFPAGTYRVDRVLVPANTFVTGDGATSIIKPRTLGSTQDYPAIEVQGDNVTITSIKIDGNGTVNIPSAWSDAYNDYPVAGNDFADSNPLAAGVGKGRGYRAGIRAESMTGLIVDDVEFTALAGAAVAVNNCSDVRVTNCYLHDSAWELVYASCGTSPSFDSEAGTDYTITGNTITNVHSPAGASSGGFNPDSIVLSRVNGFDISDNTMTGIDRDFLKLESCKNGVVAYNVATTGNTALDYPAMQISPYPTHHECTSENIEVHHNTFTGPGWGGGIQINSSDSQSQATKNINVHHNTIASGGADLVNGIIFDGNVGLYQINIHDNDINGTSNLCLNGYEGGGTGLILNTNRNDGVAISPNVSVPGAFNIHTYFYN